MADSTIDITIDRMVARIRDATPSDQDVAVALQRIASLLKANIVGNIRSNQNNQRRFPRGSKQNLVESGKLLNSIVSYSKASGGKGFAYVASMGAPYAGIHEHGGRIFAKKAFGLTVPYTDWAKGKTLRQMGKVVIVRKKNVTGKFLGFAFVKSKHRGKGNPFASDAVSHLLLKWVDIPARPFFWPGVRNSTNDIVDILRALRRNKSGS